MDLLGYDFSICRWRSVPGLKSYTPLRALNLTVKNSGITCDVQQPLHRANRVPVITLQVIDAAVAFYSLLAVILHNHECLSQWTVQLSGFNKILVYAIPGKTLAPSMPKVIISAISQLTW